MKISHLFLTSVLLLTATATSFTQETRCSLKIDQSPEIRGFRLGMAMDQVKERIPRIFIRRGEFDFYGDATFQPNNPPINLSQADKAAFEGVNSIWSCLRIYAELK